MVFESLVTDLLNKYLGQYVMNLDPSQLKIGIWGGNAKLEKLELKASALDDLDLPIQVVRGYIGKLHLSIPWKSLYTEPTVVILEDVFVLAKPNQDVKYDQIKDKETQFEKKQKQLEKLEEARRLEEQKAKGKTKESEDDDSFAEKLATQVIKNLQITIRNIHIRYEDASSNPAIPFSIGITLHNLSAQTCDEYYVPKTIKESVSIIHKLVSLENLAIYWNINEKFKAKPFEDWITNQREMIATSSDGKTPTTLNYVLNPICASTKFKLNTKPGMNNSIPKILVAFVLERFAIKFSKLQFHSLIEVLEAMSRMSRNVPFRKYRPIVHLGGNANAWWQYAINAVLEEDVRRVSKMWSWKHIKEYRLLCKSYEDKYSEHLQKPSKAVSTELQEMESILNLVSITIHRQLAINEVLSKKKLTKEKKDAGGWFGGLFAKKPTKPATGRERIEALLPDNQKKEEMEKLYKAIGYTKSESIQPFAEDYVAVKALVHLKEISLELVNDSRELPSSVINFVSRDLIVDFHQRPAANSIKLGAKIDSLTLLGATVGNDSPVMVRSIQKEAGTDTNMALVHAVFETNPLGKKDVDQAIEVAVQPVEIVYNSHTIEELIEFFKSPEEIVLQELQEKAFATFDELRVSSTAGLIHVMDNQTVMDVDVTVNASYLIIPESGLLSKQSRILVIDFGSLSICSDASHQRIINPKNTTEEIVRENCFDRFDISLTAVQILLAKNDENWQEARDLTESDMHILYPIAFHSKLSKSLVPDDPQMPQMERLKQSLVGMGFHQGSRVRSIDPETHYRLIVNGTLQSIVINIDNTKLINTLKLVESIPIPGESSEKLSADDQSQPRRPRARSNLAAIQEDEVAVNIPNLTVPALKETPKTSHNDPDSSLTHIEDSEGPVFHSAIANQVKVELSLRIIEILVSVSLKSESKEMSNETMPCIALKIEDVRSEVKLRRWDLFVDASIGSLVLNDLSVTGEDGPISLLTTPKDENMLQVKYRKCFFNGFLALGLDWIATDEAKRATIHYRDEFDATDQLLNVHFAMLAIVLHQEALLSIMNMADQFQKQLAEHAMDAKEHLKAAKRSASRLSLNTIEETNEKRRPSSTIAELSKDSKKAIAFANLKSTAGVDEEIQLLLKAEMDGFTVKLTSCTNDLATISAQGLASKVQIKSGRTEVIASTRDLHITHCAETSHKEIVSMEKDQVFSLEVMQYANPLSMGPLHPDVEIRLKFGQIKLVLLQRFLTDVMDFTQDFTEALTAMKSAGKVVADTAVVKVQDYSQTSPKVKFALTLNAPIIVIPTRSDSRMALVADLGCLKLSNEFTQVDKTKLKDDYNQSMFDTIIQDVMAIKLQDISLFKALLNEKGKVLEKRLMMEPVNLALDVTRNLTPLFHGIPDIDAKVAMPDVKLSISQDDIQLIVDVVYGNFNEGASKQAEMEDPSETFLSRTASPSNNEMQSLNVEEEKHDTIADAGVLSKEDIDVWIKTVFSFEMGQISVALYQSSTDAEADEFGERRKDDCVTIFGLGHVGVGGALKSDNSMKLSLNLDRIDLDDVRKQSSQSVATKMLQFQASTIEDEEVQKMLSINFEQTNNTDKYVDIKLRSLAIVLNIEFLMAISNMVTAPLPKSTTENTPSKSATSPLADTSAGAPAHSTAVTNDSEWPTTRVHLVCHHPRVILLADARDVNAKALFLESEINFTYFEKYGNQKMVAVVSETEITCSSLDRIKCGKMGSKVLSLAQFDFHCSIPPKGKPHVTLSTTKIGINLSPATIHTISMAVKELPAKKAEDPAEQPKKDLSKLWEIETRSEESKPWYLGPVDDSKLMPGSMVWCRNRLGDYECGFLSQKDTHCTVLFHPEGQIMHSCAEINAVLLDTSALKDQPQQHEFIVGDNVIVHHPDSDSGIVGLVKQKWINGQQDVLTIDHQGSVDSNGSLSTEIDGKEEARYLIDLSKNGKETWADEKDLVYLPFPSLQVVPGVGALVFARWKTGVYHRGRVRAHKDFKCIVYLTDLEESLSHDLDDPSAIVANACPPVERLKPGVRVICSKQNSKWFYPGLLRSIQEDDKPDKYVVHLDDGDAVAVSLGKICLLPAPNADVPPGVGCYVYVRVANGSPNYEKGVVLERERKVLVKLTSNGQRLSIPVTDTDAIVWNIPPSLSELKPRVEVIATREQKSACMSRGVVREINTMNVGKPLYRIEFWDNKLLWVSKSRIRLVQSAADGNAAGDENEIGVRREQFIMDIAGIKIRLEGYLGAQIVPLLQIDTRLHAEVKDWSSKLVARADATLTASYYNETVAEWEYLLEPVECGTGQRPWELAFQVETASSELSSDCHDDEASANDSQMLLQTPLTTVKVESFDIAEITFSKRSLLIMQNLGRLFSDAMVAVDSPTDSKTRPPFVIKNELGLGVEVTPGQLLKTVSSDRSASRLSNGEVLDLFSNDPIVAEDIRSPSLRRPNPGSSPAMPSITFQVEGFHAIKDVSIKRQRCVIYDLIPLNLLSSNATYSVVVQVDASDGQRVVVVRSPLQVYNHFPIPIDLHHMVDNEVSDKDVTIEPKTSFAVPLSIAYHSKLILRPSGHGYNPAVDYLSWNEFTNENRQKTIQCKNATNSDSDAFYFEVVREEQSYSSCRGGLLSYAPRYTFHCHPSLVLRNYLPFSMEYKTQGMPVFQTLKGGDSWPLFAVNHSEKPIIDIKLCKYKGQDWLGRFTATPRSVDQPIETFTLSSTTNPDLKQEVVGYITFSGSLSITIYSPYWLVNKSGKTLEYQIPGENNIFEHEGTATEPLLLLITGNKKKMRLRVKDCEWSEACPVDTIGSGGSLSSVGKRGQNFEIGVDIQLSYFSLTKIVMLTPRHMISNHTAVNISLAESKTPSTEWHNIPPGETVPFWPGSVPPKNLFVNVSGRESVNFDPPVVTSLLLKLDNEYGGICANYQQKDSVSLLSFSPYFPGAAPVRIESHCQHVGLISYRQSSSERSYVVCYGQSVLYTWEKPTEELQLTCSIVDAGNDTATPISVDKNEFGRVCGDSETAVYWVSFLDGLQRVLLFTEDFRVAYRASQEQTLRPSQEVVVELEGIGLSLVNSDKKLEIAYVGIRKSDVVWEEKGKNRWKAMSGKLCVALETQFQKKQLKESGSTEEFSRVAIENLEVDLNRMVITRPSKGRIRRTFHSGLSLKYIISPNLMQFYAKINAVQIDSQIPGSIFQTVLHHVAPPKSIAAETAPKPLLEFSLTSRVSDKKHVNEINYLKLLVQEMDVRVDKGFLLGIIDFFGSQQQSLTDAERYEYDMTIVKQKLENSNDFHAAQQSSRYYFDYFHMSPLKIHVSFSMVGGASADLLGADASQLHTNFLNLLMQSVGVAFTEVQDVEFKLACFEVQSMLLSQQQLTDSVAKHYQHQFLKQLYVLVFGLDVLGNPFGLISGITVGAKNFFYEPYQGFIQGPEEFAEGLALGVKSLVGGTVGGAAGAVSRITGTFGKGLAALTLDDEYQQNRRREMSQKPTNVGQGLVKGGKGLVRGVVSGVTGIVTKPVEGAKKGGAGGFFKGVGKGLIGVVARPTGGLVDFASSTFEGIKSTAGGSSAVVKLRSPRVFHADKVLRPFHEYESTGYNILLEVDKGRFAGSGLYMAHAQVDNNNIVLVTNQYVIYASKGDILSEWTSKWFLAFREMRDDVDINNNSLTLHLVVAKKKEGLFSRATTSKSLKFENQKTAVWFARKLKEAIML